MTILDKRPMAVLAALLVLLLLFIPSATSLAQQHQQPSRRDVVVGTAWATAGACVAPAWAATTDEMAVDMAAINAARKNVSNKPQEATAKLDADAITAARTLDPPPALSIRGNKGGFIKIPRIGYSFYKTDAEQAARCTTLALLAGVRHLDVGSLYGTNAEIAKPLKKYLDIGLSGLDVSEEKPELVELLRATSTAGDTHARRTGGAIIQSSVSPPPEGTIGRRGRREGLFIHHKLSNAEVSQDSVSVKRAVKAAIAELGCNYLDMVSMHSSLVDPSRRLATYTALLELREAGFVRSVGVCNFGLAPLKQIQSAKLDLPSMNQLELSPFNTHQDIVSWCQKNGVAVGCSAWSRLSSTQSIQDGWLDVVGAIAKNKSAAKAQILVRWSLQKGYTCVPRSAAASKAERVAIGQNSYGGVCDFSLSPEEMKLLDGLNVSLKAGKLGRRDGWDETDVVGEDWDPTDFA